MSVLEIVLLVLGVLIFIASFVVPETTMDLDEETERISEDAIKRLVDVRVKEAEERIDESVDETVTYAVEKSERAMERITNEKITAISEFADTVLTDINKNNQEVMFMYDMLHDKQKNLKETAIAVDKTKKEAMATKTELESATLQMKETISESIIDLPKDTTLEEDLLSFSEEDSFSFEPLTYETIDKTEVKNKPKASEKASSKTENAGKKEEAVKPQAKKKTKVVYPSDKKNTSNNAVPELSGITDDGSNNNEKILEMHRQGKSNVAIAKALGLGVGEVNLVIDLFEVM